MNYEDFCDILTSGETERIDFKIECLAFQSACPDSDAAKAELAKDVCAMANNRDEASFLVIGVADNGKDIKGVTNPGLTDDNLQAFCKDAISPPPRVKLVTLKIPASAGQNAGKNCVLVRIGPNVGQVFRLNRDFISPHTAASKTRYHFRKNEVWIRRGATSDLASPEEIAALSANRSVDVTVNRPPGQKKGRSMFKRLFGRGDTDAAELVAKRFLALFREHGVAETQIQQFLPQVTLDKLRSVDALLGTLSQDILKQAAELFRVRVEWLEGVEDRIYEYHACYKAPHRFFEELSDLGKDNDYFPIRVLYTGRPLDRTKDRPQPLALLLVDKIRDLGDEEICRYKVFCDGWGWEHDYCRIQLKAIARIMDRAFGKIVPLYAVELAVLEGVREGKLIPRRWLVGSPITEPSLEDYALSARESEVAKECEELPAVVKFIKDHDLEKIAERLLKKPSD